jgi:hypothetical protein
MPDELKLNEFLKRNILETISKHYNFKPDCLGYLEQTKSQLHESVGFVNATIEVMKRIKKEERRR